MPAAEVELTSLEFLWQFSNIISTREFVSLYLKYILFVACVEYAICC